MKATEKRTERRGKLRLQAVLLPWNVREIQFSSAVSYCIGVARKVQRIGIVTRDSQDFS